MSPASLKQLISDSHYIDAHCHGSDFRFHPSLFDTLEKEKIFCLSSADDPQSIRRGTDLNRSCPRLLNAAGIHPWQAAVYGPADLEELIPFYRRAPQISEIGLDGVWAPPEADAIRQEALFLAQLDLASLLEKPVTLHTKGTEDRIIEALKRSMPPSVLIHWFDGDDTQLKAFMDMGCFFSISPAVISEPRQRDICQCIPKDRLLAETDNPSTWPWLFGTPAKADQIRKVYSSLSDLLKCPEQELCRQFRENCRAFLLP